MLLKSVISVLQWELKAGCAPQQLDSMMLAECFGPSCSE